VPIIIAQPKPSPQIGFFINLTPLIPLSFGGEGEVVFEGAKPLQTSPTKEEKSREF
jgi:hypothetical protein